MTDKACPNEVIKTPVRVNLTTGGIYDDRGSLLGHFTCTDLKVHHIANCINSHATLRQQVLDLTEALKHYADHDNWTCHVDCPAVSHEECHRDVFRVIEDGYDIARAALDKIQGEKG